MLNSEFVNEQAQVFASYLKSQTADAREQAAIALRRVLQREPQAEEIDEGLALMRLLKEMRGASDDLALQQFCLVTLNLNEFMYLD
jgi:hypothetical protein